MPRRAARVTPQFDAFACIDWSGAKGKRLRGIAIATCAAGRGAPALVPPPHPRGWSRAEVGAWLLAQAGRRMLIGIDFSLALPFPYLPGDPASPPDAHGLWALVEAEAGEDAHGAAHGFVRRFRSFFREGGLTGEAFACPGSNGRLRQTERAAALRCRVRPSSSFNLVGAGQVGRSALTGMRLLHTLGERVRVWPFDPVPTDGALIVEIYTSIAARAARPGGAATKLRTIEALNAALVTDAIHSAPIPGGGGIDDHSSDALLTAAWLRRAACRPALWHPAGLDAVRHTEGWTFGVP